MQQSLGRSFRVSWSLRNGFLQCSEPGLEEVDGKGRMQPSHSDGPRFTSWLCRILTVMPASLSTSVLIHEKYSTHTQVFVSMKSASIWEVLGTLPNLEGLKAHLLHPGACAVWPLDLPWWCLFWLCIKPCLSVYTLVLSSVCIILMCTWIYWPCSISLLTPVSDIIVHQTWSKTSSLDSCSTMLWALQSGINPLISLNLFLYL